MEKPVQPVAEIISPGEAKFWQEQAEKLPSLMRAKIIAPMEEIDSSVMKWKIGGVVLGGALAAATFTKTVRGNWKWATGLSSAASLAGSWFLGQAMKVGQEIKPVLSNYADKIERDPALRQQLADHFSSHITAEMAANIDDAVLSQAIYYGTQNKLLPMKGKSYEMVEGQDSYAGLIRR